MDEESKPLTTFTVRPLGLYQCDRMPFGLISAPATFQWLMETCLRDPNLNWYIIYIDDIVIFLKDLASHLMRLEAMFQKLQQARLKLKPLKCKLFHKQSTLPWAHHVHLRYSDQQRENKCYQKMAHPTTITEV